jgi:hypothetical protein
MRDPRIKGSPAPYPQKQGKLDSGDQQLKSGKPGARRGQMGVLLSSPAVSLWPDGSNHPLAVDLLGEPQLLGGDGPLDRCRWCACSSARTPSGTPT